MLNNADRQANLEMSGRPSEPWVLHASACLCSCMRIPPNLQIMLCGQKPRRNVCAHWLISEHHSGLAEVRKWQGIWKIKGTEKVALIIVYKVLHDRIHYCGTYSGGPSVPVKGEMHKTETNRYPLLPIKGCGVGELKFSSFVLSVC